MRFTFAPLAAILSTVAPAFAQPVQKEIRTFHFVNVGTDRSYQELVTLIRQVAAVVPQLPVDSASRTLIVTGSADRLAVADWIVTELDGPKVELPRLGMSRSSPRQKQFVNAHGDLVDIVYLDPAASQLDMQEIITNLRLVVELNSLFNYSERAAIVFQAPPERARLAEWLISTLEKPASGAMPPAKDESATTDEYRMPGPKEDITRVFRWNSALTQLAVQQLVHAIRTEAEVTKIFMYSRARALVARGTAAQLALVSGLVAAPPPPK